MKTRMTGNNFIDANFFDRTGGPEDGAVDTILRLQEEGKIRALIRGNAQPGQHDGQHDKDAFHLVESDKYGGRFFITKDHRLLKKADEISKMLPHHLMVVKPSDFLAAYLRQPPARNRLY